MKRTVLKSITLNLFADGALGVGVSPGMAEIEVVGMLHAALGMVMRSALGKKEAEGKGEAVAPPRVVVPKIAMAR